MRRLMLAAGLLVLVPAGLRAQNARDLGVGVIIGNPTGATAKGTEIPSGMRTRWIRSLIQRARQKADRTSRRGEWRG